MLSELLAFNDQAIRSDICFLAARPYTVVLVADWWIEIEVLDIDLTFFGPPCICTVSTDNVQHMI